LSGRDLDALILKHWQLTVLALAAANVCGNVLAKQHRTAAAIALWWAAACGWAVVFGAGAPLGRTASFNHVLSYLAALVASRVLFQEALTVPQMAGAGLGLVAVALLAW
jgi:hypothetical protein